MLGIVAAEHFTGRMPFTPPNQQHQSTKRTIRHTTLKNLLSIDADSTIFIFVNLSREP